MVDDKRIREIWAQSPHFPQLPAPLQRIIGISFAGKKIRKADAVITAYLKEYWDKLRPLLKSSLLHLKAIPPDSKELPDQVGYEIIRNLLLVLWLQELTPAGRFDRFDYSGWRRQNLVRAAIAVKLAEKFAAGKPEDFFIFSWLAGISPVMFSRTIPDVLQMYSPASAAADKKTLPASRTSAEFYRFYDERVLLLWGFPPGLVKDFFGKNGRETEAADTADSPPLPEILSFVQSLSAAFLGEEGRPDYSQLENRFRQLFRQPVEALPALITEVVRTLPDFASALNLSGMENISVVRLMKDNPDFMGKEILPYAELLEEALRAEVRMENMRKQIETLKQEQRSAQFRDSVTGLYNYTSLCEFLDQKMQEAARYGAPLSFLLLDMDNFRLFNESYGLEAGNDLLYQLATLIHQNIRKADIAGRFGADEFALVLPQTGLPQVRFVAEKIRRRIENFRFPDKHQDRHHTITVSAGCTALLPDVAFHRMERLIQLARRALEEAKSLGGNCSVMSPH